MNLNRRHFLNIVQAAIAALSLPLASSRACSHPRPPTTKRSRFSSSRRNVRSCKVIGIGGAGCNTVLALLRSGALARIAATMPELFCIDLGRDALKYIDSASRDLPGSSPIKCMSLAPFGAGGSVNTARAAALQRREALRTMLADADLVFLVAGLGGGTGSGVTPIMARLARESGALTVAAVLTPFEFEGCRSRTAEIAIGYLSLEADVVVHFSNEKLANALSGDISMKDLFALQDQRIAACIHGQIERAITA